MPFWAFNPDQRGWSAPLWRMMLQWLASQIVSLLSIFMSGVDLSP
jgi:hypothetical protein